MSRIETILDEIHRRVAMYTGENTLTSIQQFLSGYSFALTLNKVPIEDDPLVVPRAFDDWVAYRLHFYESTSGWCNMIGDRTATEQESIDKFFELLTEFKTRRPHIVAKLICFSKSYQQSTFCRDDNGEVVQSPPVSREYPNSISLVTYTNDPGFFAFSDTAESFPVEGYFPDLESFELKTSADRSLLTIIDHDWSPQPFQSA